MLIVLFMIYNSVVRALANSQPSLILSKTRRQDTPFSGPICVVEATWNFTLWGRFALGSGRSMPPLAQGH